MELLLSLIVVGVLSSGRTLGEGRRARSLKFDESPIALHPGMELVFNCGFEGEFRHCIWEKGNKRYQVEDVHNGLYRGMGAPADKTGNQCGIVISNATVHHQGMWTCKVLGSQTWKGSKPVIGLGESPQVLKDSEDTLLLKEGQPMTLNCTNSPTKDSIIWKKYNFNVTYNEHIQKLPDGNLHITAANRHDVAPYYCKSPQMIKPQEINIIYLSLEKLPKSVNVAENGSLTLDCVVKGHPVPSPQWLKDGEPVPESLITRQEGRDGPGKRIKKAILRIDQTQKNDAGNYLCYIVSLKYSMLASTVTTVYMTETSLGEVLGSNEAAGSVKALGSIEAPRSMPALVFIALLIHWFMSPPLQA